MIRHSGVDLLGNQKAGEFDPSNERVAMALDYLRRRCRMAALEKSSSVDGHLTDLIGRWKEESDRSRTERKQLDYQVWDQEGGRDRLLYNHNDKIRGLWPTLQSLRHVESTALLKVL